MKNIKFRIVYQSLPIESLLMILNIDNGAARAYQMISNGNLWEYELKNIDGAAFITYFYAVVPSEIFSSQDKNAGIDISSQFIRRENGALHSVAINSRDNRILNVYDSWRDNSKYLPFYSQVFTKSIFKRKAFYSPGKLSPYKLNIKFEIFAPTVSPEHAVVLTGSGKLFGGWDKNKTIEMEASQFPLWTVNIDGGFADELNEYKFAIKNIKTGELEKYELGTNRILEVHKDIEKDILISAYEPDFGKPDFKCGGTAIPLFSLRSLKNYGIGDITSLRMMVDWAVLTSQRFIQLLPINDTTMSHTWRDSYPYNANSIYAIHPLYIDVQRVGIIGDLKLRRRLEAEAHSLNSLPEIDYERVDALKWTYLRAIFAEKSAEVLRSNDFIKWFKNNISWVEPYTFFCALRERYCTADFTEWGKFSKFNLESLRAEALVDPKFNDEVLLHVFVQYHLSNQLSEVKRYALSKGVVLKGDIPIGISRHSVEAWTQPELFNLDSQAGAPPDDFARDGQNWGFPTYNWAAMAADGYKWWINRFKKMSEYFGAYRIDHLLGFFRIWEIPVESKSGLLGHFSPALPYTVDELKEFGFELDKDRHTSAYISSDMLEELFPGRDKEVIARFFDNYAEGMYRFNSQYASQRLIEASIKDDDELRDVLMSLHTEVLFIEDPKLKNRYNPRISAHSSNVYRSLSDSEKSAFNKLYEDFYYVRHNQFWKEEALRKLPALVDATGMLACVEDLGMIPRTVPEVIDELQLISLEIERMPKGVNQKYGYPEYYPYLTVATTSSHDMSPLRIWWDEMSVEERADYYYNHLHNSGDLPDCMSVELIYQIISRVTRSNSMLAIIPFQDWIALDESTRRSDYYRERINVPANPDNYWRYRMHLPLERIMSSNSLNGLITELMG